MEVLMVEMLAVVDMQDRVVGRTTRRAAARKGLLHRAVDMLVYTRDGRIVVQQRSASRRHCPRRWDVSVSGHVHAGESYREAAVRELREELGVRARVSRMRGAMLQEHTYGRDRERELVELWKAVHDGPYRLDKKEVAQVRLVPLQELRRWARQRPRDFTPWFWDEWRWLVRQRKV